MLPSASSWYVNMKFLETPDVIYKYDIKRNGWCVGYILLVHYFEGATVPHVEYSLNAEYRNQGIMTCELKKFLEGCKECEVLQLLGLVDNNNEPSIKTLEGAGFVRMKDISDKRCYIMDLRLDKKTINDILEKIQ